MKNQYHIGKQVLVFMQAVGFLAMVGGIMFGLYILFDGGGFYSITYGLPIVLGGIFTIGFADIGKAIIDGSIAVQKAAKD